MYDIDIYTCIRSNVYAYIQYTHTHIYVYHKKSNVSMHVFWLSEVTMDAGINLSNLGGL